MNQDMDRKKVLMLTLFPFSGNGSATVVRDLATVLSPSIECMVFYVDTEISKVESYQSHFHLVTDFPVLRTHPKSRARRQFIEMSNAEIDRYVDDLYDALGPVVESFNPDLIHVHHGWLGACVAQRFKKERQIPFLVQFHGTELEARHDYQQASPEHFAYQEGLVTSALKEASRFVAISPTEEEAIQAYATETGLDVQISMIPNGYDESIFFPAEKDYAAITKKFGARFKGKKLDPNLPIAMFVGRFVGFKGIAHLIRAVPHVQTEGLQVLLCGGGELFDDMVELSQELELDGVYFMGHVDHFDDLPNFYNVADVLVMPSEGEPFGLVAIEAMGCGTPIIGSDSGALPFILGSSRMDETHGDLKIAPLGVLAPYGDEKAIAAGIDYVLQQKWDTDRSNWLSEQVRQQFSVKAQANAFSELYDHVSLD